MGGQVLQGTIVKGLGEGTYFMSMEHYKKEFRKKFGFEAYSGTLNLRISQNQFNSLKKQLPVKIKGYKSNKKIFGAVNCRKAKIKDINAALIIPELTKHKDIVEIIAPVNLKSELKLKDGYKLRVELL